MCVSFSGLSSGQGASSAGANDARSLSEDLPDGIWNGHALRHGERLKLTFSLTFTLSADGGVAHIAGEGTGSGSGSGGSAKPFVLTGEADLTKAMLEIIAETPEHAPGAAVHGVRYKGTYHGAKIAGKWKDRGGLGESGTFILTGPRHAPSTQPSPQPHGTSGAPAVRPSSSSEELLGRFRHEVGYG